MKTDNEGGTCLLVLLCCIRVLVGRASPIHSKRFILHISKRLRGSLFGSRSLLCFFRWSMRQNRIIIGHVIVIGHIIFTLGFGAFLGGSGFTSSFPGQSCLGHLLRGGFGGSRLLRSSLCLGFLFTFQLVN